MDYKSDAENEDLRPGYVRDEEPLDDFIHEPRSLRNWFAGMAMQGILSHTNQLDWVPESIAAESWESVERHVVEIAFGLADAMVKRSTNG